METFLQYISCYDIVLENWEVSQSLFYWNPFCNRSKIYLIFPITCRKVAFLPSPCANIKNKLHLINICTTNIYNYTVKYRNKQPNIQNTKTNFKDYP